MTHTWQTTKELSSQPLGGPRDHNPNHFSRPWWSRFGEALLFCRFDISWAMASSWTPATMQCGVAVLVWKPATFEVVTAKSRCQKDYLPRCVCCLAHVGPVFYARSIWDDLQSGDRYGSFCANGFCRRRYLFSTAQMLFWYLGIRILRIPTADQTIPRKGAFADCTRPVRIPYQFYFVPRLPVCCSFALAISHTYLVSHRTEESQWHLFPMIW